MENLYEYVACYIGATDDGMFDCEDDLAYFVIDQLIAEFPDAGDAICRMVDKAMQERSRK